MGPIGLGNVSCDGDVCPAGLYLQHDMLIGESWSVLPSVVAFWGVDRALVETA